MLEEKKNKIKELFFAKTEGNSKRKIENLVVFAIILIVTVLLINTIWNKDKKTKQKTETTTEKVLAQEETTTNIENNKTNGIELEQRLETILQNIEGVGKVKVLLTYSQTSTYVPIYNENTKESNTTETDSTGGSRTISQEDSQKEVIYKEDGKRK